MNSAPFNEEREQATPIYEKKRRSPVAAIIAVVLALIALVVAVILFIDRNGGAPNEPSGELGSTPTSPGSPGSDDSPVELTIGIPLEPTNLNIRETAGVSLDQLLIDNVYEGLVTFAPGTVDIQPLLAESFVLSDDATVYTFELRDDVTFHSGNAMTTTDVVDSLEASLAGQVAVGSPNDGTVTLTLEEPNSFLLPALAGRDGLIFESAASNDLANSANGTGPYLLQDWKQGDSATLEKNPNYWGDEATLDRVIYRYIPDANAAVNASLGGDLDVQLAVQSTLRPQFDHTDFTLVRSSSTDVFTLAFNSAREPFDNERVRQALSMAIDTDALIEALGGDGLSLGGPITPLEPGYEDLTDINAYDPDAARQMLEDEGIDGLTVTVTAPNFYETTALDVVATQFNEVGVTLSINVVEFGTWLEDVYGNADFDLSYVDHAEGFDFGNYANPNYYFGYDNPQVQDLYAQALASSSLDAASPLLQQAARLVAEDAPAKWLYNYNATNAIGDHVHGFPQQNTNSRINLEGVTIKR